MNYLITLLSIVFFLFLSCKSESDKRLDRFKNINESLKETRIDTYKAVYSRIGSQKTNNIQLFLTADSLVTKLESTNKFIDSIITVVEKTDSGGEKTDIGKTLLTGTKTGEEFINRTNSIYLFAVQHTKAESSKEYIERCFKKYGGLFGKSEFNKAFINQTPSIGVTTILRGVKSDCTKSCLICLGDIENRLNQ